MKGIYVSLSDPRYHCLLSFTLHIHQTSLEIEQVWSLPSSSSPPVARLFFSAFLPSSSLAHPLNALHHGNPSHPPSDRPITSPLVRHAPLHAMKPVCVAPSATVGVTSSLATKGVILHSSLQIYKRAMTSVTLPIMERWTAVRILTRDTPTLDTWDLIRHGLQRVEDLPLRSAGGVKSKFVWIYVLYMVHMKCFFCVCFICA